MVVIAAMLTMCTPVFGLSIGVPEDFRRELSVVYQSGDSVTVTCADIQQNGGCGVKLLVNGKAFFYGAKDLNGLSIAPRYIKLYAGGALKESREASFSFVVSVWCPESIAEKGTLCFLESEVVSGKIKTREVWPVRDDVIP